MAGLRKKVLSGTSDAEEELQYYTMMHEVTDAILQAQPEEVVKFGCVVMDLSEKAQFFTLVTCSCCGGDGD